MKRYGYHRIFTDFLKKGIVSQGWLFFDVILQSVRL